MTPFETMTARGITPATLAAFGVVATTHYGRPALRYPIRLPDGTLVGRRVKYTDGHEPKALWPTALAQGDIAPQALYGADLILANTTHPSTLFLVEGEPDAWLMHSLGLPVVSLLRGAGAAVSDHARYALDLLAPDRVYVVYDTDQPGWRGGVRVARDLMAPGRIAQALRLPDGLGEGGDVTDLYVWCGRDRALFVEVLASLSPLPIPAERRRSPRPASPPPGHDDYADYKRTHPLQRFVEELTGREGKPCGHELVWRCLLPGHDDHTPSFSVNPEKGLYFCYGCLPPGSLVKTSHGMRPIDSLRVGDLVYAFDGRLHRVSKTHEHQFEGELISLRCSPFKSPILLTGNHKIPVMRPKSKRLEEVEAAHIKVQNYLLYPRMDRIAESLSFTSDADARLYYGKPPTALPDANAINIDDLAEWLGWYLAEGSTTQQRTVCFSLCRDEYSIAKRLASLTQSLFGTSVRISEPRGKPHSLELITNHALLARWVARMCGSGARSKHVPGFVWGWTSSQQYTLFKAYVQGDGHIMAGTTREGYIHRPTWRVTTASATLVDDLRDLLLKNGITPSSLREQRTRDGRVHWRMSGPLTLADTWGAHPPQDMIRVRVKEVSHISYTGSVYNLTVEDDHHYTTMSGVVCNCGRGGDIITLMTMLGRDARVSA